MSVSKMEKLTVIVPRDRVDTLLARLMRLRCVDLIDMPYERDRVKSCAGDANVAELMARAERIDAILPALHEHAPRKRRLFRTLPRVRHSEFRADGRMDLALKVVEETEHVLQSKKELAERREKVLADMKRYTPYLEWDRPLDFVGTASTALILGAFPARLSRTTVVQTITNRAAMVQIIGEDSKRIYAAILVHHSEREETLRSLAGIGFAPEDMPAVNATPKTLFEIAEQESADIEDRIERLNRRLVSLSERVFEVEVLSDIAHCDLLAEKQKQHLVATKTCAVLCAWCPVSKKARVSEMLDGMEAAYEFSQPEQGEKVPRLLANKYGVQCFERLLGTNAYPVYGKFDPTLPLAILFCLVFGLMYPDVGYGFLMALPAFLVMKLCRLPRFMRHFFFVMGCCGVSAMLFGALYGSYFGALPGMLLADLPDLALLPDEVILVVGSFRPDRNPAAALVLTFLVGMLHVALGQILSMIELFRARRAKEALLNVLPYLTLTVGFIALCFYWLVGVIVICCATIAIPLTQGLQEKGFKEKLLGALWGCFRVLRYAGMFFTYTHTFVLAVVAAPLGLLCWLLPVVGEFPFVMFIAMMAVFCITYMGCVALNFLLAAARMNGLKHVDILGRFYDRSHPIFRPLTLEGRYAEDITPVESNSF